MSERCFVTGVAALIGPHLPGRVWQERHELVGLDCLSDRCPRQVKEANLLALRRQARFRFADTNLCSADLTPYLGGAESVFHQAAQRGVRTSCTESYRIYPEDNVLATQRLLGACKDSGVRRFVYASWSSICGDTMCFPVKESSRKRPISPYGATKLAGEHLPYLYRANLGVRTAPLPCFTVHGARQRRHMALYRFMTAIHRRRSLGVHGDGEQARDFAFVADDVEASILVLRFETLQDWRLWNIGGSSA